MKLPDNIEMNPWLEDKVQEFHAFCSDDELQKDYHKLYGHTKYLGWNDYLIWKTLKEAVEEDSFLAVHRYEMDLTRDVKKWLYRNNVDRVLDLIQMTDEELRAITVGNDDYYKQITQYLSYNRFPLRHGKKRTYKISSNCSLKAEYATRLDKWIIKAPGTINTFNLARPTLDSEWFDEFYKRYVFVEKDERICRKLVPTTVGLMRDDMPSYFNEFFNSLKSLWDAYYTVRDKYSLYPYYQTIKIPESFEDLRTFPLDGFIELKKEVLRAFISALEQTSIMLSCSVDEYFKASDEDKLNIVETEKNEDLQLMMIQYVALKIDFENVIWDLDLSFEIKNKPWNEWPFNPWIQEIITGYRTPFSDAELHDQYSDFCGIRRRISWIDFLSQKALANKISDCPILLTATDDMELDRTVKNGLKKNGINNLAQLLQYTDFDVNHLFYYDKNIREQISAYLEKQGFRLYHSDTFTYKVTQ